MRSVGIWLFGLLGALLVAGLANLALPPIVTVQNLERGDPVSSIMLKLGFAVIASSVVAAVLTKMVRRRLEKGTTEFQLTVAALGLMAIFFGSMVLSMRIVFAL